MSSNLLSPKEAALYLKVSEKTLEGWRSAEVGPTFFRLGNRCVRYFKGDIDAWLRAELGSKLKPSKASQRSKLGISTAPLPEPQPC